MDPSISAQRAFGIPVTVFNGVTSYTFHSIEQPEKGHNREEMLLSGKLNAASGFPLS